MCQVVCLVCLVCLACVNPFRFVCLSPASVRLRPSRVVRLLRPSPASVSSCVVYLIRLVCVMCYEQFERLDCLPPHPFQRVKINFFKSLSGSTCLTGFNLSGVFGVFGVFEVFKGFDWFKGFIHITP